MADPAAAAPAAPITPWVSVVAVTGALRANVSKSSLKKDFEKIHVERDGLSSKFQYLS